MVAKPIGRDRAPAELRAQARGERDGRVRARLLAIAACLEGMPRCAAARLYGMSRNVLGIWVDRYNAQGVAGLRDRPRAGRRPQITPEQGAKLREQVLAGPDPARDGVVAFRLVDVHRVAGKDFDVEASFLYHCVARDEAPGIVLAQPPAAKPAGRRRGPGGF